MLAFLVCECVLFVCKSVTYLSLYLLYNAHSEHITDCAVCKDGNISIGSYSCSACNGTADKITIDFYGKLLTTTLLPMCVIAVLGLIHLRVRYKHQTYRYTTTAALHDDSLNKAIAKHSRALLAFTFLIFSPVSTVVFQTFACDYLAGTNNSWLRADYSISCHSDRYKAYRVYGVSMILLYPLGIPALYIMCICYT
jgi:hypothetical protein